MTRGRHRKPVVTAKNLFDACKAMPAGQLRELVELAEGAAYLIEPERVRASVERLESGLREHYPRSFVAYSYKTNYQDALIAAARDAGALSEVVSGTELAYALQLGVGDRELIFNGPGKTTAELRDAMQRELVLIVDSINELRRLAELARGGVPLRATLGIRLAPDLSFQREPSRFGIDLECADDLAALRALVSGGAALPICGVHLHLTCDRSVGGFVERIDHLLAAWRRLGLGPLRFIDCGGGFASAVPDALASQLDYPIASLREYGAALGRHLRRRVPDQSIDFLCEPGTGILADAGVIATPVLDVKCIAGRSIAVVDGTAFTIAPLRSRAEPVCWRVQTSREPRAWVAGPVAVYGNSCMEIDRLIEAFDAPLAVGDVLLFAQKGAYAGCVAAPFIQGIPAVVALESDSFRLLRRRTGPELLRSLNASSAPEQDPAALEQPPSSMSKREARL